MRGSRRNLLAVTLGAALAIMVNPFKQAFAVAHAAPSPPPDVAGGRRNKVRKGSQRASGAAAQQRAARKRRCARARAPKRRISK